jgi:hypothetical protein
MQVSGTRRSGFDLSFILGMVFLWWLWVGCSGRQMEIPDPVYPTITLISLQSPASTTYVITPNDTPTPTQTRTATSTPTFSGPTPSSTLASTLTPDERNEFILDLVKNNGGCSLPCFWGLIPGETEWEEANQMFQPLGKSVMFELYLGHGLYKYEVEPQNHEDAVTAHASFYVKDGRIQWITSQQIVSSGSPRLGEFVQALSLKSILLKNGIPERITVSLGVGFDHYPDIAEYGLLLYYDQRGFQIYYSGISTSEVQGYNACPNKFYIRTQIEPLRIMYGVQSPDSDQPLERLEELMWGQILNEPYLEEVTGLGIEELTTLVVDGDESACFVIDRDFWP